MCQYLSIFPGIMIYLRNDSAFKSTENTILRFVGLLAGMKYGRKYGRKYNYYQMKVYEGNMQMTMYLVLDPKKLFLLELHGYISSINE